MPCGVQTTQPSGVVVTCDNAGTSAHTGLHSGLVTQSVTLFGRTYNWSSVRVYWKATAAGVVSGTATVMGRQKTAVLGESDYV